MTHDDNLQDACAAFTTALTRLIVASRLSNSPALPPSPDEIRGREETAIIDGAGFKKDPGEDRPSPTKAESDGRVHVYLAGARGLGALTKAYGSAIMTALGLDGTPYIVKAGTTTVPLDDRLRQIAMDLYGAATRTEAGIEIEPGFDRWIAHVIAPSRQPRDPAVTLLSRAIAIDLPKGLTRRAFDARLRGALKGRALDGLPAAVVPKRYAVYDLIETRLSAAKELYLLSPHKTADCDLLLEAIETILTRFRAGKG